LLWYTNQEEMTDISSTIKFERDVYFCELLSYKYKFLHVNHLHKSKATHSVWLAA